MGDAIDAIIRAGQRNATRAARLDPGGLRAAPRQAGARWLGYRAMSDALTGQTVELLQQMIRNQCVNDGTVRVRPGDADQRRRCARYLEGSGLDVEVYEPDGAPRAARASWPASRAPTRRRPRCASWATPTWCR